MKKKMKDKWEMESKKEIGLGFGAKTPVICVHLAGKQKLGRREKGGRR